jgi:hypothetical protein
MMQPKKQLAAKLRCAATLCIRPTHFLLFLTKAQHAWNRKKKISDTSNVHETAEKEKAPTDRKTLNGELQGLSLPRVREH